MEFTPCYALNQIWSEVQRLRNIQVEKKLRADRLAIPTALFFLGVVFSPSPTLEQRVRRVPDWLSSNWGRVSVAGLLTSALFTRRALNRHAEVETALRRAESRLEKELKSAGNLIELRGTTDDLEGFDLLPSELQGRLRAFLPI